MVQWLLLVLVSLFHSPATTYARMVDRVSASIVRITMEADVMTLFGPQHVQGVCSGEVIAQNWILTAHHCLGNTLMVDGRHAVVIQDDSHYDLALLYAPTQKPILPLRDQPVRRFEPLTAMGYAWGWTRLTVLRAPTLLLDVRPETDAAPGLFLQVGYIGGMSGGPVVDEYGYLVGIVQRSDDGVGYGVNMLLIRAFLFGAGQ